MPALQTIVFLIYNKSIILLRRDKERTKQKSINLQNLNDLENFKTHFKNTYRCLYFQKLCHKMTVKIFAMITSMFKIMLFLETLENHMNRKCSCSLNIVVV